MKHIKILTLGIGSTTLSALLIYGIIELTAAFPEAAIALSALLLFTVFSYLLGAVIFDYMGGDTEC